ncbi:decaprenyl-phosphate phosphoribosyltransferase [Achromobacter sp. NCFB-sbj8-Ac1-l]|uniref:decaprenyl-phosphate phosphoribosyltransferase n=1 Tax=unclassified Achromobacter TaxID=2626865 RepID=UPI004046DDA3
MKIKAIVGLLRPHQWIKNGFVLVGVLFSFQWISRATWLDAGLAFIAFCCAASAVYVLNDCKDVEADRQHPKKRFRPLAAGLVSQPVAIAIGVLLVALALAAGYAASIKVLVFVCGYLLINVAYTLWLKHEVIVDVFCIFGGFMMRLLAGTVGIGLAPSRWLLITGMMITLFLGFGKRRAELATAQKTGNRSRKSLDNYSLPLLDKFISICAAGTVITYGLYTVDSATVAMHRTQNLIWTMPIVIFGIFRYLYLIHHQGKGEDTSKDLFKDVPMLLAAICWVTAVVAIMSVR